MVESDRVGALQPGHAGHEVRIRRLDHQVVVVAHQAKGMDLPAAFLASLGQRLEKILPIYVVQVDVLPTVPTAHDVVHCSWILNAHLPWHDAVVTAKAADGQDL
jgi:hypothetical protein